MIDWREMERTFRNAGFQAGFREGVRGTPSTGFGGMMQRLESAWKDGHAEGLADGRLHVARHSEETTETTETIQ